MEFAVRTSSRSRAWSGFEACLYDTTGGFTQSTPTANHVVSMAVGAPVRATCRCEGPLKPRLQIPGDLDLLPPGTYAAWHDEGPTTMITIWLSAGLVTSVAHEMGVRGAFSSPRLHVRDERIEHVVWALKAELESADPFDRVYAESLGVALCAQLLRKYSGAPPVEEAPSVPKRRLQRVVDYVHERISEDLSLADLAAVAELSPSHLKSLFKQFTGMPVHRYVMRARVEYAISLITLGNLPLCDVAGQAGFANQSHMARWIRRVTGITPKHLRDGT